MEWYLVLAVIGAGFIAGFINTLAGSGSLLTLPLLIFLGLPPTVANGTNRVAILLQTVVAVSSFKKQKVLDTKTGVRLGVFALLGSVVGAMLAADLNEQVMEHTIGFLLIIMTGLILFKPQVWIKEHAGEVAAKSIPVQFIIYFFIGIYGGFIQAGVGFFLLAGLVLGSGLGLVKANAIKLLIMLIYTPVALAVFMWNNQVDYKIGLILALGNMLGALVASRLAIKRGAIFIRYFLIIALTGSVLKLFGVF
ncbi:MAG: sulfite exporter TauE/SafE family protein [Bacteroidota bacterium]